MKYWTNYCGPQILRWSESHLLIFSVLYNPILLGTLLLSNSIHWRNMVSMIKLQMVLISISLVDYLVFLFLLSLCLWWRKLPYLRGVSAKILRVLMPSSQLAIDNIQSTASNQQMLPAIVTLSLEVKTQVSLQMRLQPWPCSLQPAAEREPLWSESQPTVIH